MMFKGTPRSGTLGRKARSGVDRRAGTGPGPDAKEQAGDGLALRHGEISISRPRRISRRAIASWTREFRKLIDEQRALLVKNEFDRCTPPPGPRDERVHLGGLTGYFINVPANKLELWCWMESERLLRPVFREFYAERDVVYEERRMRGVHPIGKFAEEFNAVFWDAHPTCGPSWVGQS